MNRIVLIALLTMSQVAEAGPASLGSPFAALEKKVSGRIGVAVLNTSFDAKFQHRADDRFPMCSTFKFLLVAQILKRVESGQENLERLVPFSKGDLLSDDSVLAKSLQRGGVTIRELCAAAIQVSDNSAANLLLKTQGGPAGLTKYLRSIGDSVTRLDRIEPELNKYVDGENFDTTTPRAIAMDMKKLMLGGALSDKSRDILKNWLLTNTTGGNRLKAGTPATWKVADKTGTCGGGSLGDIAVLYRPNGSPVVVSTYVLKAAVERETNEAVFAEIARWIAAGSPP